MLSWPLLAFLGFSLLANPPLCHEPEYFGICNPYVPGILIRGEDFLPVRVLDTWPFGPAEGAGICAGDKVMAVNGVSCTTQRFERVLHEIVQSSPQPLALRIERSGKEFDVRVVPVRESELVARTGRKYLRKTPVAFAQQADGFERTDEFLRRVGEPFGLKNFEGVELWSAADVPEENIAHVVTEQLNWRRQRRVAGVVPAFGSGDEWSTGASVLLLEHPNQVVVIQCFPGSPAYREGVRLGDEISRVETVEVDSDSGLQAVREVFQASNHARRIKLGVHRRSSEERNISFETAKASLFGGHELDPVTARPVSLLSLTPDPASMSWISGLHLLFDKRTCEAMVSEIDFPSPAFDSGLLVGDQLVSVNGTKLNELSAKDLETCTRPASAKVITFEIRRGAAEINLTIRPQMLSTALRRIGRKPTANGPCPVSCCSE